MIEFKIPDMTCGHCARAVTQALKQVDEGCAIQFDLPMKTVKVASSAPVGALSRALVAAGYPPL